MNPKTCAHIFSYRFSDSMRDYFECEICRFRIARVKNPHLKHIKYVSLNKEWLDACSRS